MRKVWLIVVVLMLAGNLALAETVIKGSIDFKGDADREDIDFDTDEGFSIAAEQYFSAHEIFDIGLGAEYQFRRAQEGADGEFNFIPVYAAARFSPIALPFMRPYATGRIGYGFFLGDDTFKNGSDLEGGFHWGAGVGAQVLDFIIVEGLYTVSNGNISDARGDFEYSRFSLYAGVAF